MAFPTITFTDDSSMANAPADNLYIETRDTTSSIKNVRIQSRDYTATSGEHAAVQIKPNISVGGTTGITGLEISPRFAEGIAGGKIVGIFAGIDLKGAAGGNCGPARCVEAKLESASGSTRTVSEAWCIDCMNSLHGTVTDGPAAIHVGTPGGNVAWESVMELVGTQSLCWHDTDTGTGDTEAGYFKVIVNGNARYVALYSDAPSA